MREHKNKRELTMVATAAILAGLGSLVAVPAVASARDRQAAAASLSTPPVVTEKFGSPPLACDQNTTVGLEGCGEHKVLADDKQLDADIRAIWGHLASKGRQDFVVAQADWQTYRNADCQSQSDVYQGGTLAPVAYVNCLSTDDVSRRQDLKGFFEALTQGMSPKPAFP
jgi:uncharacterized protein YecT (DUF1311 family)